MASQTPTIVLGSRSPRRRELLELLVPPASIVVRPPRSHEEPGFENLHDWHGIEDRVCEIVRIKLNDVLEQCRAVPVSGEYRVLCADTVIVGQEDDGRLVVLGQPPDDDSWRDIVADWFRRYYLGKTHWAVTCVSIADPNVPDRCLNRTVSTSVRFATSDEATLDWYLSSDESLGKAGGYGLQGMADVFVEGLEGSPSNVIGLPLRETRELLLQTCAGAGLNRTSER